MKYFSMTDIGKRRTKNEDSFCSKIWEIGNVQMGLFAVADGMGGHDKGEYASRKTIDVISNYLFFKLEQIKDSYENSYLIVKALKDSISKANEEIVKESKKKDIFMGTTIAMALIIDSRLYVANVGDSRTYMLSGDNFVQISRDNSYVQELVKIGAIKSSEARTHKDRNKITRAVGIDKDVEIDFYQRELQTLDKILICSDGLTTMLEDSEIKEFLVKDNPPEEIVKGMMKSVNDRGAYDNTTITCVLI